MVSFVDRRPMNDHIQLSDAVSPTSEIDMNQALSESLIVMERLPRESWERMSDNAVALTEQTKMNWRSVWQLLRFGVYALDRRRHAELIAAHSHQFSMLAHSNSPHEFALRRRPTHADALVNSSEI